MGFQLPRWWRTVASFVTLSTDVLLPLKSPRIPQTLSHIPPAKPRPKALFLNISQLRSPSSIVYKCHWWDQNDFLMNRTRRAHKRKIRATEQIPSTRDTRVLGPEVRRPPHARASCPLPSYLGAFSLGMFSAFLNHQSPPLPMALGF